MSKSFVELKGNKIDIQDLEFILNDKDWTIDVIDGRYLLSSKLFESIDNDFKILLRARQFLDILNGLATALFNDHIEVKVNTVLKMNKENKLVGSGFLSANCVIRSRVFARLSGGGLKDENYSINKYQSWIELSKADESIREMLHFFNDPNWWNLYKIHEILQRESSKLGLKNLVSKNKIKTFSRTANDNKIIGDDARHATFNGESIKNPMDIKTARKFIFEWFEKLMEYKTNNIKHD